VDSHAFVVHPGGTTTVSPGMASSNDLLDGCGDDASEFAGISAPRPPISKPAPVGAGAVRFTASPCDGSRDTIHAGPLV